jgi:UDP-N-acetylglucosamine 2-epimerase (non-hydrolysing)
MVLQKIRNEDLEPKILADLLSRYPSLAGTLTPDRSRAYQAPIILVTGHRRENFGEGFKNICRSLAEIARAFPDVRIIYPVHMNPNVQGPVNRILGQGKIINVFLVEPLDYLAFVYLMNRSYLILTDSGGVQEEAPSLGKPVLVMRDTTERPEAVEMGTAKLVGTDKKAIVAHVSTLLTDPAAYNAMAGVANPYGDGLAASRIIKICRQMPVRS